MNIVVPWCYYCSWGVVAVTHDTFADGPLYASTFTQLAKQSLFMVALYGCQLLAAAQTCHPEPLGGSGSPKHRSRAGAST